MITYRQIINSLARTGSYTQTGKELGISKEAVHIRVLKLKVQGIGIPGLKRRNR